MSKNIASFALTSLLLPIEAKTGKALAQIGSLQ